MTSEYESAGCFSEEELKDDVPSKSVLRKKKVAMIECLQSIPCNACLDACRLSAIIKKDINEPPKIDWDKCNGCLECVRKCPGLAAFALGLKDGKAQITIPWEMQYIPKVGETVDVLDRRGKKIGQGVIMRVIPPVKEDKTWLVTFETDENLVMKARNIRRRTNA